MAFNLNELKQLKNYSSSNIEEDYREYINTFISSIEHYVNSEEFEDSLMERIKEILSEEGIHMRIASSIKLDTNYRSNLDDDLVDLIGDRIFDDFYNLQVDYYSVFDKEIDPKFRQLIKNDEKNLSTKITDIINDKLDNLGLVHHFDLFEMSQGYSSVIITVTLDF